MTTKFFSLLSFVALLDPGSEIQDPGWVKKQDPGSEINIPDPQHCRYLLISLSTLTLSPLFPIPLPPLCCWQEKDAG
jgi:hypothetical protein